MGAGAGTGIGIGGGVTGTGGGGSGGGAGAGTGSGTTTGSGKGTGSAARSIGCAASTGAVSLKDGGRGAGLPTACSDVDSRRCLVPRFFLRARSVSGNCDVACIGTLDSGRLENSGSWSVSLAPGARKVIARLTGGKGGVGDVLLLGASGRTLLLNT